jgi:hypothetical protein
MEKVKFTFHKREEYNPSFFKTLHNDFFPKRIVYVEREKKVLCDSGQT